VIKIVIDQYSAKAKTMMPKK
ncbi:MAG: pyridoxamine 5'-phosphate oxidase family protein, partial [Streptococcus gallolyticus]|nr:pyridoxamine 5'-phosphate oxidase family protein [Streptococcus gallolyticus]